MKKSLKFLLILILLPLVAWFLLLETDISVEDAAEVLTDGQSQFVEIDGMKVHFKREGSGKPLVLIHGTGSFLHTWDGWTELMKDQYEIVRLDMPGFGMTGPRPDGDYSIDAYTDFLHEFCEKEGLESFHLAGNSLGGHIAWKYALAYPEMVERLILLAPAGFKPKYSQGTPVFRLAKNKKVAPLIEKLGTTYMVRRAMRDVYHAKDSIDDEMVQKYLVSARREGNRRAFLERVQQENPDTPTILKQLEKPVLLVWGKHDKLLPDHLIDPFMLYLPDAQLKYYTDAGHTPMEEYPYRSAMDALEFLEAEAEPSGISTDSSLYSVDSLESRQAIQTGRSD